MLILLVFILSSYFAQLIVALIVFPFRTGTLGRGLSLLLKFLTLGFFLLIAAYPFPEFLGYGYAFLAVWGTFACANSVDLATDVETRVKTGTINMGSFSGTAIRISIVSFFALAQAIIYAAPICAFMFYILELPWGKGDDAQFMPSIAVALVVTASLHFVAVRPVVIKYMWPKLPQILAFFGCYSDKELGLFKTEWGTIIARGDLIR